MLLSNRSKVSFRVAHPGHPGVDDTSAQYPPSPLHEPRPSASVIPQPAAAGPHGPSKAICACLFRCVSRLDALGNLAPHRNFGPPQLIGLLQVQPELRRRLEIARQPERGVGGDAALPVDTAAASRRRLEPIGVTSFTLNARPENVVGATAINRCLPSQRHRTRTPRECSGGAPKRTHRGALAPRSGRAGGPKTGRRERCPARCPPARRTEEGVSTSENAYEQGQKTSTEKSRTHQRITPPPNAWMRRHARCASQARRDTSVPCAGT